MAKVPLIQSSYPVFPERPSFFIGWPGAMSLTGTAALPPTGGSVKFNNGSHFNTSTMRFTCPVAGLYLIGASYLRQNASNAVVRMNAFKNGTGENQQLRSTEAYTGFNYTAGQWWLIKANVGDLLDVRISADSATSLYADGGNGEYNWICGYLIG
jgi:hypothetical protein